MTRYYIFILTLLLSVCCKAQIADSDFDTLSKKTSEQLMIEGRKHFEQREPSKALSCFLIVSLRYKENFTPDEIEFSIRALNNCGCVYKYFYFEYPQAYDYFTQAYELCESTGHNQFLPVVLVNLGDLLNDYGVAYNSKVFSQQADNLFDKCISIAMKTKNWELLTTAFFNLSNQRYNLDLQKYNVIFSKEIPDSTPDINYARLQYRGIESIQKKQYAEARQHFEHQLTAINACWQADRDTISTYSCIAKTYELENNYEQAAVYLQKALKITRQSGFNDISSGICKQLSRCYQQTGDTSKQQYYHLQYLELMEEMHNKRLGNIAELSYINELKKEEAKTQELAIRQRLQQYVILGIIVILLVVIASAIILLQQNRTLQSRNKSIYEKYKQILRAEATEQQLRKKQSQPVKTTDEDKSEEHQDTKYSHSNLNSAHRETLLYRIQEVFNNPEIICMQDFNMSNLTKMVDSNTTYVSQVINEKYGMTFSTVLGSYRIKEACRRINESSQYDNITIEGIARSIGFKSRSAFINAFKREVGLTPSEYIRMATVENSKKH